MTAPQPIKLLLYQLWNNHVEYPTVPYDRMGLWLRKRPNDHLIYFQIANRSVKLSLPAQALWIAMLLDSFQDIVAIKEVVADLEEAVRRILASGGASGVQSRSFREDYP